MEDYKEVIKEMLLRDFDTAGNNSKVQYYSTSYILKMVRGVIPSEPIDEHCIFEVMQELNFKRTLHHFYKKDDDGNNTEEIEFSAYLWQMYFK